MLSKSAARGFFILGTAFFAIIFLALTYDTFQQIPKLTNSELLSSQVAHGKKLWDESNCMGCHTILGEGAYYAPELTKVYINKGPEFIKLMLSDPAAMYPGERKMVKYDFTEEEREDLVAFLKWISEIDTNGFPPKPVLEQ